MIKQVAISGFDNNFSYFVIEPRKNLAAIVDPSNLSLLEFEIEQNALNPKMVLITHTHHDHVEGVEEIVSKYGFMVYAHKNAKGRLDINDSQIVFVDDNEIINLGKIEIKVLYTPGHIDDAVCYYIDAKHSGKNVPQIITGDTLFVENCGRADLEFGNVENLYKSLQRIKSLPEGTEIYPGHDYGSKPVSTIGWEKEHNKYLACKNFEEFKKLRLP